MNGNWSDLYGRRVVPGLLVCLISLLLFGCLESDEPPKLTSTDLVQIASLDGTFKAYTAGEGKEYRLFHRFIPQPNKRYVVQQVKMDLATHKVEPDPDTLDLALVALSREQGLKSFLAAISIPPSSNGEGSQTLYYELRQTGESFSWGWFELSPDQGLVAAGSAFAKTKGVSLVKDKLEGPLTAKTLQELFSEPTFRNAFKIEYAPLQAISNEEKEMLAAAGYSPTGGGGASKGMERSKYLESAEVGALLLGLFTKPGGAADARMVDSKGGSWLEETATGGDLWAKYFLALAHFGKAAGGSREAMQSEKFEAFGLPDIARPYWNRYLEFVREWKFVGSYGVVADLANEGVRKNFAPLIRLLGRQYVFGLGIEKNEIIAFKLFEEAANLGDAEAMNYLAWSYERGVGVKPDYRKALDWYQMASNHGNAEAMGHLATMYLEGRGVRKDGGKANRLLQQAASLGNTVAMHNLAVLYRDGEGVDKDGAKALFWFQQCANQDEEKCMTQVGVHYALGNGVTRDDEKAVRWFRKAADESDAIAMDWLGSMYEAGRGVPKDFVQAFYWYKRSAEHGDADGMWQLSRMYDFGRGVLESQADAVRWNRNSADQGHPPAMEYLGRRYYRGHGVSKDYAQAAYWIHKAAEKGDVIAMMNLGAQYYSGRGVPQDNERAKIWLRRAASKTKDPKVNQEINELITQIGSESDFWKAAAGMGLGLLGAYALFGGSSGESDTTSQYSEPLPYYCEPTALDVIIGPGYKGGC